MGLLTFIETFRNPALVIIFLMTLAIAIILITQGGDVIQNLKAGI